MVGVLGIALLLAQIDSPDNRLPSLYSLQHCVASHIDQLDDRVSPARDVARALAIACQADVQEMAKAESIHDGHPEPGFAKQLAREMMNGEQFIGDVLKHRTGAAPASSTGAAEGVNTVSELEALCRDEAGRLECFSYLRGFVDSYIWTHSDRCVDKDMEVDHVRDLYLNAVADLPGGAEATRMKGKLAGALLAGLMHTHSHPCK